MTNDTELIKSLSKRTEIRIAEWNDARNLTGYPEDHIVLRTILEELFEYLGMGDSDCKEFSKVYSHRMLSDAEGRSLVLAPQYKVDALCDIVVLANGFTHRLGYDPLESMNQTLLEIEDRTGEIGSDGKWYKHKDPEITKNWYKADYSKAKY